MRDASPWDLILCERQGNPRPLAWTNLCHGRLRIGRLGTSQPEQKMEANLMGWGHAWFECLGLGSLRGEFRHYFIRCSVWLVKSISNKILLKTKEVFVHSSQNMFY